jgi:hypothetical protein
MGQCIVYGKHAYQTIRAVYQGRKTMIDVGASEDNECSQKCWLLKKSPARVQLQNNKIAISIRSHDFLCCNSRHSLANFATRDKPLIRILI